MRHTRARSCWASHSNHNSQQARVFSERRLFCVCFFFTSVIAKCDRGSSGLQLEKEDKEEGGASRELLATSSPFSPSVCSRLACGQYSPEEPRSWP